MKAKPGIIRSYFEYRQNNSGGSFHVDDKVCQYVIIEANSVEDANKKALELGLYWNGVEEDRDCECCGDRWYPADSKIELEDNEEIEEYIKRITRWPNLKPTARIFYRNGDIFEI